MTTLLSLILIALIVLIILTGIGIFNIRCICNYYDFIQYKQYHLEGILKSIQSTVSNVIINQGTLANHTEAIADDVENTKLFIKSFFECPEDETDDSDMNNETDGNNMFILKCLHKKELEMYEFIFNCFLDGYDHTVDEEIEFFDEEDKFRYYFALEEYHIFKDALESIRNASSEMKVPDDAPAEQTDEEFEPDEVEKFVKEYVEPNLPVADIDGLIEPTTETVEMDDLDSALVLQKTLEKEYEDIPATPVEAADTTEDKGEADA